MLALWWVICIILLEARFIQVKDSFEFQLVHPHTTLQARLSERQPNDNFMCF